MRSLSVNEVAQVTGALGGYSGLFDLLNSAAGAMLGGVLAYNKCGPGVIATLVNPEAAEKLSKMVILSGMILGAEVGHIISSISGKVELQYYNLKQDYYKV